MSDIDDLVNRPSIAPWEPKGQVNPDELPDKAPDTYPPPWTEKYRGNGHHDIYDGNGKYILHMHCWDMKEYRALCAKLRSINGEPESPS